MFQHKSLPTPGNKGCTRHVLIMEGKKGSSREAMKQCLLAMRDCWDNNDVMKWGSQ